MTDFPSYNQSFSVPFEYPVHFARDIFDARNDLLVRTLGRLGEKRRHRCLVFVDSGVSAAHSSLTAQIKQYFHEHPRELELAGAPEIVPGGEAAKSGWTSVRDVMWEIGNLHLDRQSFVIAVGGGSVVDMVGFAASIVHRGLRLLRVPTTTLAQADAGIGVKNGMDEHGMKNFVGTFAPPFAVINDFSFLPTLSAEDWIGGAAEAFKVAIIKDADFFNSLFDMAGTLRRRQAQAMEQVVYRTALLHLEHIRTSGDPFEFGSARPLDFGHWAAHRLEAMTGFRVGHGQAVSIGIALDSYYAMTQGLLSEAEFGRIVEGLLACGLPIWHEALEERTTAGNLAIIEGLEQFREHLGGELTVTLPRGIGSKVEVHHVDSRPIEDALAKLKSLSRGLG